MTPARRLLEWMNATLAVANLRLDSRTVERLEARRLDAVSAAGGFSEPVYPLPSGFAESQHQDILDHLAEHEARFETFEVSARNDVGFEYGNGFFESADAEVLYTVIRGRRPGRIVEIGCGNSTRVIRQAIMDGTLESRHRCIDPEPRVEITGLADEFCRQRVESLDPRVIAGSLHAGDILFIDTSHEVKPANDVAYIYGRLLPLVVPGVLVHIHDIFIPYDYPESFARRADGKWGEQYLVQVMLENTSRWEVLWPGYYLQRTLPGFEERFPRMKGQLAQSLWLMTR